MTSAYEKDNRPVSQIAFRLNVTFSINRNRNIESLVHRNCFYRRDVHTLSRFAFNFQLRIQHRRYNCDSKIAFSLSLSLSLSLNIVRAVAFSSRNKAPRTPALITAHDLLDFIAEMARQNSPAARQPDIYTSAKKYHAGRKIIARFLNNRDFVSCIFFAVQYILTFKRFL